MFTFHWIWWWHTSVTDTFARAISWGGALGWLFTGYPKSLVKSWRIRGQTRASSTPWVLKYCCPGRHMITNPLFQAWLLLDSLDTIGRVLARFPNHLVPSHWESFGLLETKYYSWGFSSKTLKTRETPQFQAYQRRRGGETWVKEEEAGQVVRGEQADHLIPLGTETLSRWSHLTQQPQNREIVTPTLQMRKLRPGD